MQTIAKKPHTASITIAASDSAESRGKTIVSFIYERKKQKLGRSLDGDDQESADVQLYDSKRYAEFRAQSVLVPTSGGYVADDFLAALELALIQGDPVRQVATVVRNEIGSKYSVPTVNDTATDAEVLEENDTASEADVMFGQSVFAPHKYNSKGVRVPNDLLEDAPAGFATDLARVLSRRISRKQGADFSVGDGAAKPFGIVTQAVLGVTAASAVAITGDELYDLIFSIDAEFLPRSAFMMHPTIYRYLSKLVDGAGAYKLRKFGPFNLAGFNVVLNRYMASTLAASARPLIFGDLAAYRIVDHRGLRLTVSRERYAELDQAYLVANLRSDGAIVNVDSGPIKALQMAAS